MSLSTKKTVELPLLRFFLELRAYDRQSLGRLGPGLEEYLLALDTLNLGYGFGSTDDLYSICKALWFKPYHTEKAFRQLFDKYLDEIVQAIRLEQARRQEQKPPEKPADNEARSALPGDAAGEEEAPNDEQQPEENAETEEAEDNLPPAEGGSRQPTAFREEESLRSVYLQLSGQSAEVAQAGRTDGLRQLRQEVYHQNYILRGTYFPLKSRKMQQSYQMIRRITFEGRKDTINWPATIRRIAQQGFFDDPVLMASPQIKSGLYILVDSGGSMLPFADLTRIMVGALRNFVGKKTQAYYFRNCPIGLLYEDEDQTRAIDAAAFGEGQPRSVIIVSDGGAARGGFNPDRVKATQQFLHLLKKHKVVWLNPMPADRWTDTTADYIHSLVPMYELTETGFVNAIKALKLKHRNRS